MHALAQVSQLLLSPLFHQKFRLSTFYHFVAFIDISKEKEIIKSKKEFNLAAERAAGQAWFLELPSVLRFWKDILKPLKGK